MPAGTGWPRDSRPPIAQGALPADAGVRPGFNVVYADELSEAAAEADAPRDAINFLRALPDRIYTSPSDVLREFGEASACFGLFSRDVHHRENIGRSAVETGANPTRHT